MNTAPAPAAALNRFGTLLGLIRKAREADTAEGVGFLAVNETHLLSPYRQGALWCALPAPAGRVAAVSGQPQHDRDAPYIVWLSRLLAHCAARSPAAPLPVTQGDLPEELAISWDEWLPEKGLWLPLTTAQPGWPGGLAGGLFLARETDWPPDERALLETLCGVYALAWAGLLPRPGFWSRQRARAGGRYLQPALAGLILLILALPVRQSVLAPAEVIAASPAVIRAPMEGVVDRFHVEPNQEVTAGQLLLSLDRENLGNRLEVSRKEWETALVEYRQATQRAVRDSEGKTRLALLKKRLEQKAADVTFVQENLERLEIRAPRDGIAIFADANDWIGRPVSVGERILTLAEPDQVALEIHLPVADAINLEMGAEVAMFLNIHPDEPLPATLTYASYQAQVIDEGLFAYRLKAAFDAATPPPRIGLRGTARIYHHRVSVFRLLFRRPGAALRQWLGW